MRSRSLLPCLLGSALLLGADAVWAQTSEAQAVGSAARLAVDPPQAADPPAAGSSAGSEPAPIPAPPQMAPGAKQVPFDPKVFNPDPSYPQGAYDVKAQEDIYGAKHAVTTARPWIEWGRNLYDAGELDASRTWFGDLNPAVPNTLVYGDWRTAVAENDNGVANAKGQTRQGEIATRLNLDINVALTSTERFHFFIRPFDRNGDFLRYDFDGKDTGFRGNVNADIKTAFFEGDLGRIADGLTGRYHTADLPFAVGLVPLFTQNGIWLNDAFFGGALTLFNAKNNRNFGISNMDLTVFTGLDQVSTPAVEKNGVELQHASKIYGVFGFVDALRGYFEFGYGYVDSDFGDLSYHNLTVAYTHRYWNLFSNSVRVITNLGQNPLPGLQKTANGTMILVESSLISPKEGTLIPYLNLFAGFNRTQALARAGDTGNLLNNTGINFETDGLTGSPLLDDTGFKSYGGALGVEYLFNLDRQIVVEGATVQRMNTAVSGPADEYGLGVRFQQPLTNAWILRADVMRGWLQHAKDVYGLRLELRRKI
jgi:hypothetical protein